MGVEDCASKQQLDNLFQSFLALSNPILPGESEFLPGFESASSDEWTSLSRDTSSDSDAPRSSPKRKAEIGTSSDQKKAKLTDRQERRRMQNRQAAATSRIKKKNYNKELEAKVDYLTQANMKLQFQVAALMEQNLRLQDQSQSPVSTSRPLSGFVTLESAELGYPQQSEVMKPVLEQKMEQGLSLLLLGILSIVMLRCGLIHNLPPMTYWDKRRLERRRFIQARQARREKMQSLATLPYRLLLHTDGTPPIRLMS